MSALLVTVNLLVDFLTVIVLWNGLTPFGLSTTNAAIILVVTSVALDLARNGPISRWIRG